MLGMPWPSSLAAHVHTWPGSKHPRLRRPSFCYHQLSCPVPTLGLRGVPDCLSTVPIRVQFGPVRQRPWISQLERLAVSTHLCWAGSAADGQPERSPRASPRQPTPAHTSSQFLTSYTPPGCTGQPVTRAPGEETRVIQITTCLCVSFKSRRVTDTNQLLRR